MASYQKRGKTWQYTISNKGNPIRKGGFRTKAEAVAVATEIEANLRKGLVPHLNPEPFDDYFEKWIQIYKVDISQNTRARYLNTHKTIKEYFGNKPIQNIEKKEYQIFLNEYGKNRSKASVKKVNTHIRACVKDAIDEGVLHVDFTRNVKLTGKEGKPNTEKHLDYKESQILLNEIYKKLEVSKTYYLLLLALTSGMRFGELVGLTRNDFNFFNNTIAIKETWGYSKDMHEGFGDTKNKQSVRIIKMDQQTMITFQNLFDRTPTNIHNLVFYSPQSKYKVVSNNAANKLLKNTLKRLGIDPISMHGLRHTHASVLLYKKVSIYYVSERLGHNDIDTTLKEYSHVIKELREEDEDATTKVYEQMLV